VGAGGLGCPAALYLAASGIGRLTLADPDRIDLTNLQRQILYRTESVGRIKVEAAKDALAALNPDVSISILSKKLRQDELDKLVPEVDVVLDCSDNFATRHAVNRACVKHRRPLVAAAAIRFDGQLMVFDLRKADSPCYACFFPEDGEVEEVQCSQLGVFAPLTGVMGAMQATEAIKLLSGAGEPATGRLMVFDAKRAEWRAMKGVKDPRCAVCAR
jgi:molybdopterin-synthase adenylyltransferase